MSQIMGQYFAQGSCMDISQQTKKKQHMSFNKRSQMKIYIKKMKLSSTV